MTEADRGRVAAMLAANSHLQVRAGFFAFFRTHADEGADPVPVDCDEGVGRKQAAMKIFLDKDACIVPGKTECRLGQIVGAEAEEFGRFSNLVRDHAGAGQFDHGADHVCEVLGGFLFHLFCYPANDHGLIVHFGLCPDERDHHFGNGIDTFLLHCDNGFKDGSRLHFADLWIADGKAAAAMAQHRVGFVQFRFPDLHLTQGDASGVRYGLHFLVGMRQELVQRWIKETNGCRQSVHDTEEGDEILPLIRQQLGNGRAAGFRIAGQDHFPHMHDPLRIKEHMLGTRQANAFRTELDGGPGIQRCFRIGPDAEGAEPVYPAHQFTKIAGQFRLDGGDFALHHLAGGTVQGDNVTFGERVPSSQHHLVPGINFDLASAGDAWGTHATGNDRRM